MQQPDFWFRERSLLSDLLLPFAALFAGAGKVRRALVKPVKLNVPLICVGNINVGGTGKTPFCLYLAELLRRENIASAPVFLSRMEDEARLLEDTAPVIVGAERGKAALLAQEQGADIIIMDDGMQNPSVKPDIVFCVADARGFGNKRVMPAGPLREILEDGLPRVDAFVFYSDVIPAKAGISLTEIQDPRFREDDNIFQARVVPKQNLAGQKYLAFCGIGNPDKFRKTLEEAGATLAGFQAFPDHHVYTHANIALLKQQAAALGAALITTTKDKTKIDDNAVEALETDLQIENEAALLAFIKTRLKK
ncbi:MAG: tetraacyldisaccharide 4'-kinase [Alphaproteobacteria bacterium]|nr:tetraacyldisaccharide 4'-kinase [Alphaproteobacteria bacterium]